MENATLIVLQFYHDWFSHIVRFDDVSIFLAPLEIVMKPLIQYSRLCSALGSLKKKKIFVILIKTFCRFAGCLALMKGFPRRVFESERDYIGESLRCRNIIRLGLLSWKSRYPVRKLNCNKKSLFYKCFRKRVNESNPIVCCDWCILAARKNGSLGHVINPLLTKREVKMAECWPCFFVRFYWFLIWVPEIFLARLPVSVKSL